MNSNNENPFISLLMFVFFGIVCVIILAITSCKTITPIIIRDVPEIEIQEDMTLEEYLVESQTWGVMIKTYVNELINQIIYKVPHTDLRKKNIESITIVPTGWKIEIKEDE